VDCAVDDNDDFMFFFFLFCVDEDSEEGVLKMWKP